MLLANILLALAWTALQGSLSLTNLVVGYGLGYLVLRALAQGGVLPRQYVGRVGTFLGLFFYLVYELILANIRLTSDVVRLRHSMRPAVIRLPLDARTDGEILMLAALINLTPGSIALDVSEDRRHMYVHVMDMRTPADTRRDLKHGFERWVIRLFATPGHEPAGGRDA
jgi:multicomponent Na+:H+ antiporter subunit E